MRKIILIGFILFSYGFLSGCPQKEAAVPAGGQNNQEAAKEADEKTVREKKPHLRPVAKDVEAFYYQFMKLYSDAVAASDENPDEGILKADLMMMFVKINDGHKFDSGRVFQAESSLLLYTYLAYIRSYYNKKDCEKAREYYNKFRRVEESDYLVISLYVPKIFHPLYDKKVYEEQKRKDLEQMHYYLDWEEYEEEESKAFYQCLGINQVDAGEQSTGKIGPDTE